MIRIHDQDKIMYLSHPEPSRIDQFIKTLKVFNDDDEND